MDILNNIPNYGLTASDLLFICAIIFGLWGIGKLLHFKIIGGIFWLVFAGLLYTTSISLESGEETSKEEIVAATTKSIPKFNIDQLIDKAYSILQTIKESLLNK